MKKHTTLAVCIFAILLIIPAFVSAMPNVMSYQGKLNDRQGNPINGSKTMTFTIYDAPSGGNALWTETQSVTIVNGIFNVELGNVTPLSANVFAPDNIYLGLRVENDNEMSPKQKISSTAYSFRSQATIEIPVGTIMAWTKALSGVTLPAGWVECNGQTLSDTQSPMNGKNVPNLNGEQRFLRGSAAPGGIGGKEKIAYTVQKTFSLTNTHPGIIAIDGVNVWSIPTGYNSMDYYIDNQPPYYDIVWIIKVR